MLDPDGCGTELPQLRGILGLRKQVGDLSFVVSNRENPSGLVEVSDLEPILFRRSLLDDEPSDCSISVMESEVGSSSSSGTIVTGD